MKHHGHTIRTYIIIVIASLFVVGASFWYGKQFFTDTPVVTTPGASNNTTKMPMKQTTKEYSINSDVLSIPDDVAGSKVANVYLQEFYGNRVSHFITEAQESYVNKNLPKELLEQGVGSSYSSSYSLVASTTRFLSYVVTTETYYIGAAHPSHLTDTFVFDKKLGKLVTPHEYLTASSTYLPLLSRLSVEYFKKQNSTQGKDEYKIDTVVEESPSDNGFSPFEENFSAILPTSEGLRIYFQEYQIAPYSAGPQQALIPYSALRSVIALEGVLAEYK